MSMSTKKRLIIGAGALLTAGATLTAAAGFTLGLFSANSGASGNNTFTTGTVSIGSPTTVSCTIANMVPGDESTGYTGTGVTGNDQGTKDAACTFAVTYTGSAPAWLGLSTTDTTTSSTNLYAGTAGTGLQLQISDGSNTNYTTTGVINANTASSPMLVSKTADAGGDSTVYTFTVNYALPSSANNTYQAANTKLTLTVYAVQAGNNGSTTACTAGTQCVGVTSWS